MKLRLIIFILAVAPVCFAQAPQDAVGGRTDVVAGKSLMADHVTFPVNCSKTTTSEPCTVTNSTITAITQTIPTAAVTYSVSISSPSMNFNIAVGEPGCGSGFGNTMTYSYDSADFAHQGADVIASVTVGTPGSITFTTDRSGTESATNGNMTLRCGPYTATIATPNGTGSQLADHFGNWLFFEGVAQACSNQADCAGNASFGTNVTNRYGGNCQGAKWITADLKVMGFNGVANDSGTAWSPNSGTCTGGNAYQPFPGYPAIDLDWLTGASQDRFGFAPQLVKDLNFVINQSLNQGIVHQMLDVWDTNDFPVYVLGRFGSTGTNGGFTGKQNCYSSPLCLGNLADDVDANSFGDPSTYWVTRDGHFQGVAPGYIAIISATHETMQKKQHLTAETKTPALFDDNTVWVKHLTGSHPSCFTVTAITNTPCSIVDFLYDRYTNHTPSCAVGGHTGINALNDCWGSSYTTSASNTSGFGSNETAITGEVVGSGNGATTTFNLTFANGHVTRGSVYILVSGNKVAGDCPFDWKSSTCTGSAGNGQILSPLNVARNTGYGNKQYVVNADGNVVQSQSTNGSITAVGAPTTCTAINCTYSDGGVTFKVMGPSVVSTSTITYGATSSISVTFANAPPTGTNNITTNYTFGGWADCGAACGVADEDGSHSWIGTNSACMLHLGTFQANTSYSIWTEITDPVTKTTQVVTVPGTSGGSTPSFSGTGAQTIGSGQVTFMSQGAEICGPDAGAIQGVWSAGTTAQFGQDMEDFIYQYGAAYYQPSHSAWKQMFPGMIYMGIDSLGDGATPAHSQILEVASLFDDLTQVASVTMDSAANDIDAGSGDLLTTEKYIWESYYESLDTTLPQPIIHESFIQSTQSPSGGCDNPCIFGWTTQAKRGAAFYNYANNQLTKLGYNGTKNIAGTYCWSCVSDIQGHGYGLESQAVNTIDGATDVAGAVVCPNGFTGGGASSCGSEPGGTVSANWSSPYGFNAILCTNCVQTANNLWLQGVAPSTSGPATKSIMMARIIDPAWIAEETHYAQGEKR